MSHSTGTTSSNRSRYLWPIGFIVMVWAVEILDIVLPGDWEMFGIRPRDTEGLFGVVAAPLLHDDFGHLINNSIPLLILGGLLALSGPREFFGGTAVIWIVGGVAVWILAGAGEVHIGASGIVFGWIGYLLVQGFFSRQPAEMAIAAGVLLFFGASLLGVLPGQPGVSWQGHLFGALAGVGAAWALSPRPQHS